MTTSPIVKAVGARHIWKSNVVVDLSIYNILEAISFAIIKNKFEKA